MIKADKSKRNFFKKAAAAAGFVSAAGYLGNLISGPGHSMKVINENSAHEANMQKRAWMQKQWVPMTDDEKRQMLDEIVELHNNHRA